MALPEDPLDRGIDFLKKQDAVFARNAWMHRWLGWICGWGGTVIAALGAASLKLFDGEHSHTVPVWCGFAAAALTGVNQTIKPDVWADAYYRGHLLLEEAIGDHLLGKATADDLTKAWHRAQSGLPGALAETAKKDASS